MNTYNIMEDPFQEKIRDFSMGLMDGLTVPISVASGLVASGRSKEVIVLAIIAEAVAGSVSMGLSDYLSVDAIEDRKDIAWKSGLRVGISYFIGACIPLISFLYNNDVSTGFKYSIIFNIMAMIIFGYYRAIFLHIHPGISIKKVLVVGVSAMLITYCISSVIKI